MSRDFCMWIVYSFSRSHPSRSLRVLLSFPRCNNHTDSGDSLPWFVLPNHHVIPPALFALPVLWLLHFTSCFGFNVLNHYTRWLSTNYPISSRNSITYHAGSFIRRTRFRIICDLFATHLFIWLVLRVLFVSSFPPSVFIFLYTHPSVCTASYIIAQRDCVAIDSREALSCSSHYLASSIRSSGISKYSGHELYSMSDIVLVLLVLVYLWGAEIYHV